MLADLYHLSPRPAALSAPWKQDKMGFMQTRHGKHSGTQTIVCFLWNNRGVTWYPCWGSRLMKCSVPPSARSTLARTVVIRALHHVVTSRLVVIATGHCSNTQVFFFLKLTISHRHDLMNDRFWLEPDSSLKLISNSQQFHSGKCYPAYRYKHFPNMLRK
jgi:hypothetical protein